MLLGCLRETKNCLFVNIQTGCLSVTLARFFEPLAKTHGVSMTGDAVSPQGVLSALVKSQGDRDLMQAAAILAEHKVIKAEGVLLFGMISAARTQ